jgi:uncharacterized protein YaaW (UPF0174 family)
MSKVTEDLLTISDICRGWDTDNIEHLAGVLKLPDDQRSIANIEKEIKWLFHSKTIAKGKVAAKSIWSKVTGSDESSHIEDQYNTPTYQELLSGLLTKLKVRAKGAKLLEQEMYLCDAVNVAALAKMTPVQRRRAFAETLTLAEIVDNLESTNGTPGQTAKGVGAFTLANAAGFSLYTSATTALGLASSMAGVTLPFAIYTGMTSFISVIIGPVGWVAAGSAIAFSYTSSSEWDRLRIALLYIITIRHKNITDSSSSFFASKS